jgi:hypothetical protein
MRNRGIYLDALIMSVSDSVSTWDKALNTMGRLVHEAGWCKDQVLA